MGMIMGAQFFVYLWPGGSMDIKVSFLFVCFVIGVSLGQPGRLRRRPPSYDYDSYDYDYDGYSGGGRRREADYPQRLRWRYRTCGILCIKSPCGTQCGISGGRSTRDLSKDLRRFQG